MLAIPEPPVRTVAEAILNQLRQDILDGTHPPGSRLRFQPLHDMYGASFSTLREALAHLTCEGLTIGEGQRGFRVVTLTRADLFDLYASWIVIERACIARALPRGDAAWEATLRRILGRFQEDAAAGSADVEIAQPQAEQTILDAIVAPCGSPTSQFLRRRLAIRILHYWQAGRRLGMEPPSRPHDHAGLLEAALQRDVAATVHRAEQILHADLIAFDAHAGTLWQPE